MTRINRAAWQRIKARLAEPKQSVHGKFYPGTVTSLTIDGKEFPVLDSKMLEFRDGNRIQIKGR